jgi:hypothetical protein
MCYQSSLAFVFKTAVFAGQAGADAGFGGFFSLRTADDLITVLVDNHPRGGFSFGVPVVFFEFNLVGHFTPLQPTTGHSSLT